MSSLSAQEEFKQRLADLKERIRIMEISNTYDGSNIVLKKVSKQSITTLREQIREAEELLEQLPRFDDCVPTEKALAIARDRQRMGDHGPIPSIMKTDAWTNVRNARTNLAIGLDTADQLEEALPEYFKLVKLSRTMQDELWESEIQEVLCMNLLGVCYKRMDQFDLALEWYEMALEKAQPGSLGDKTVRASIQDLYGIAAGPIGAFSNGFTKGVKCCWTCGKNTTSNPDLCLQRCNGCTRLMVSSPAYYCDSNCQKEDWEPRHKKFHKNIKDSKNDIDNYGVLDPNTNQKCSYKDIEMDEEDLAVLARDPRTRKFHEHCYEAVMMAEEGNMFRARQLLQKAIKIDPTEPCAHMNLCLMWWDGRNFQESIKECAKARCCCEVKIANGTISSEEYEVFGRSTGLWYKSLHSVKECMLLPKPDWMTDPSQLLEAAEQAVIASPSCDDAWGMLGDSVEVTDPKRALQCYQKAVRVSSSDWSRAHYSNRARKVVQEMVASAKK